MTRPVYYKSFRSRKFQNILISSTSVVDAVTQSDDIILDIGFGTGESTVALNEIFSNHTVCGIEAYKPGIKKLIAEKIPVEFGDAAAKHSIGPEAKTQGIVGPVDLTTPHPEIAARLRTGQARQLFEPFQAEQWHAIVRLEYRFDSELNDQTKAFLGSLLLSAKTKDIQKTLHSTYLEGS